MAERGSIFDENVSTTYKNILFYNPEYQSVE
jgi:hypothetical protein